MRYFTILLPIMLIGCGNNLVGTWEGTCEFNAYDMDVEVDIEEDDGGDLKGEVNIQFNYYSYEFDLDGELEGQRDGKDVELDFDFDDFGSMEILGEITDKDTIEAECTSASVDADIELER